MSTGPPTKNGNGRIPRWALALGAVVAFLVFAAVLPRIMQQYQPTTSPIDMQPLVSAIEALMEATAKEGYQTRSALTDGLDDQKQAIADLLIPIVDPPDLDYMVPAPPEEPDLTIALDKLASDVAAVDERVATLQRMTDELAGRSQLGIRPTPEEDFVPIQGDPTVALRRSIAEMEDRIEENANYSRDQRQALREQFREGFGDYRDWMVEQLKLKQDKAACPYR